MKKINYGIFSIACFVIVISILFFRVAIYNNKKSMDINPDFSIKRVNNDTYFKMYEVSSKKNKGDYLIVIKDNNIAIERIEKNAESN